jgi:hypothetical protein
MLRSAALQWYHYDCVGLEPPAEEQNDEEVAPEDFKCPRCCIKANQQYLYMRKIPATFQKQLEAFQLQLHHSRMPPNSIPVLQVRGWHHLRGSHPHHRTRTCKLHPICVAVPCMLLVFSRHIAHGKHGADC